MQINTLALEERRATIRRMALAKLLLMLVIQCACVFAAMTFGSPTFLLARTIALSIMVASFVASTLLSVIHEFAFLDEHEASRPYVSREVCKGVSSRGVAEKVSDILLIVLTITSIAFLLQELGDFAVIGEWSLLVGTAIFVVTSLAILSLFASPLIASVKDTVTEEGIAPRLHRSGNCEKNGTDHGFSTGSLAADADTGGDHACGHASVVSTTEHEVNREASEIFDASEVGGIESIGGRACHSAP